MQEKQVAILSSEEEASQVLISLLDGLKREDYNICLYYSTPAYQEEFRERQWAKKGVYLGPSVKNKVGALFFLLFLLPLWLYFFFFLLYIKYSKKINYFFCFGFNEKIVLSLPGWLLKINTIWLQSDETINSKILFWFYKLCSRKAKIVVWGEYLKRILEKRGIRAERIIRISPGIKIGQHVHQENIFSQMAEANRNNFKEKFFNIGAILDLNKEQKLEILFQAIKICLPVIPNIQLVVVGEGKERKNLMWLAKKMEIDSLVWFVGEQKHIKKWLANFDIFVLAKKNPEINNMETILYAMDAGLPIIGPINSILEDIVEENKAGSLIEIENSEMLARQIIKLYKDKRLRLMLGQYAQKTVREKFSSERMVEEFGEIL